MVDILNTESQQKEDSKDNKQDGKQEEIRKGNPVSSNDHDPKKVDNGKGKNDKELEKNKDKNTGTKQPTFLGKAFISSISAVTGSITSLALAIKKLIKSIFFGENYNDEEKEEEEERNKKDAEAWLDIIFGKKKEAEMKNTNVEKEEGTEKISNSGNYGTEKINLKDFENLKGLNLTNSGNGINVSSSNISQSSNMKSNDNQIR